MFCMNMIQIMNLFEETQVRLDDGLENLSYF